MPSSNYPNGFADGVTIKGVPLLQTHPGKVFWVYNGTAILPGQRGGSNGNKGTFDAPFSTIDYAIGQCVANRGDIIFVKAGHSETITAAAGIDADVAGIAIVGLGTGRNRPTINFSTATTADIDIDAANVTIKNFFIDVTGIDAVVAALDVNAADFTLEGCEVLLADSGGQATEFIVTDASADRMSVLNNVIRSPNAGANNAVSIEGTPDGIVISGNRIYGDFADACIHNPTGNVATNLVIEGNYLQNDQTGDHAIELVSACTGTISKNQLVTDAIATAVDQGSCNAFDNLYYDSSDVDAGATPFPITTTTGGVSIENIQDALYGSDGVVTFPTGAAAGNGVSMAEVLRYIQDQIINGTGTVLDTNTSLYGVLAGATGIPTYPAAAAAANSVSMAEVLRYVQDRVAAMMFNRNSTNYLSVTADFTSATWNTAAAHEIATVTGAVHLIILPQVTGTLTSAGGTATLILGDETTTNSIITSTDAENLAVGEWWFDSTDTRTIAARSIFEKTDVVVGNGKDIGYTIGTEALTGGSIVFHMWWEPIDATGAVAAGAGGAL